MKRSKLFKPFFYQLLKPLSFWSLVLYIISEFLLYHNFNKLPYKFLNHTSGPARLLGDYAKKEVIPKDYFALVGDSNVYGFGPWLYDNSWSMGQPNFATHHLLHQTLKQDVAAFGYPGFGNMGSALSAVAEHRYLKDSFLWSDFTFPKMLLFVFYEGNDLINNLHEVEQRGFNLANPIDEKFDLEIKNLFKSEEQRLHAKYSILDQSPFWNLSSGIFQNYFGKLFKDRDNISVMTPQNNQSNENDRAKKDSTKKSENIALINESNIELGYCEGPALHMTPTEINQSIRILHHSLVYLKNYFSESNIGVVYLPSSLSVYNFKDSSVRPAPLQLNSTHRNKAFPPEFARERNFMLRNKVAEVTTRLDLEFIDTTDYLNLEASRSLLHGPRDPIHLNRKGYETFSAAIVKHLNSKS